MGKQRIQAEPVTIEGIRFDSKFEGAVFRTIRTYVPKDEIITQHKIPLIEESQWFRETSWRVDFYIPTLSIYIEAKGYETLRAREFSLILRILAHRHPQIAEQLIIVSEGDTTNPGKFRVQQYRNLSSILLKSIEHTNTQTHDRHTNI